MLWFSNVNKYLWSRERTPYFTAPEAMTATQARHEFFAYAVLLGSVFGIVALGGLIATLRDPAVPQVLWMLCGGTVLWACVDLVRRGDLLSAWIVALAPAAIAIQTVDSAIRAGALGPDRILIIGFSLLLMRYGWRLVRIARCQRAARARAGEAPAQDSHIKD